MASDLRALNGHLDLASTAILTAIELGHLEGRPATEATLARTTGLSKQTVARRLQGLIEAGEIMRARYQYRGHMNPSFVYVLDPHAANDPGRVQRVRDAIRRHAHEMRGAIEAMGEEEQDDALPVLSANGRPSRP